jgi:DNA-binding CsgD family transcriptional regulator
VKDLSIRETQVIRLVAAGMTTKAIAATLSIAESTVNWHVGNALAKLGASSRAEAVAIVMRDGPPEAPVVIIQPRARRRIGWRVAAAVLIAVVLALAGGTSVATWYLGTHRDPPTGTAAPTMPSGTEPASARPSTGGGRPSAAPSQDASSAGPAVDPTRLGSAGAPTLPFPLPTPAVTAPSLAPAITLPPLPSLPPLPTATVPPLRRVGP